MIDGHDQNNPNLPPVIFASLFVSSDYKTICIYGNIGKLTIIYIQNT